MRHIFLIMKHEIVTTLTKRSFWLTTFVLPAIIIVLSVGSQALAHTSLASDNSNPLVDNGNSAALPVGYVDEAGFIQDIPQQLPDNLDLKMVRLRGFRDQASARTALESGKISRYYVIPADYIATGNLTLIDGHFSVFNSLDNNDYFEYVLRLNLTHDANLAALLANPTADLNKEALAPQGAKDTTGFASYGVPFVALFVFYFAITMTSGFMLQSIAKEKENRTIEVLLLSARPRDVMLGKVFGLGVVALVQVAIWLIGGQLVLTGGLAGSNVGLPSGFLIWALLYFVLGYLLYASVLGAIGAMAPSAREGARFTFLAMFPLFVPLVMNSALVEAPNGTFAVVLSLFPLTAPVTMIVRLASGVVPLEQLLLGLVLLVVTTYFVIVLASRFFRADTLLNFQGLSARRIIEGLRR